MEKDAAGCRAFNRNYIVGDISYTGLQGQRSLRKRMVPTAGCYNNHLLPLGAGTSDGSAEKRNTAINDRDLCGVTGAEADIMQRCGTLRHTAYWEGQSEHLPRL